MSGMDVTDLTAAFTAALAPLVEKIDGLAGAMSELASAQGTDSSQRQASSDKAPTGPPTAQLSPLIHYLDKEDDDLYNERYTLANAARLDNASLDVFCDTGARGLYRAKRDCMLPNVMARHHIIAMIEDAAAENPQEAAEMGADLLKDWGAADSPV